VDDYAIIGVSPDASLEEIEHAYRAKMLLIHPDLNQDPRDTRRRTKSSAELIEIIEVLRDPARRASYDEGVSGGLAACDRRGHSPATGDLARLPH
jgi:curved DNA-binding protein CbpA